MLVSEATHSLLQGGPSHPDQDIQRRLQRSLLSECHLTPLPESWFALEGEGLGESMKEATVEHSALEVCVCVCVCVCSVCLLLCNCVPVYILLVGECIDLMFVFVSVPVHRGVQLVQSCILFVTPSVPCSPTSALLPTSVTPHTWPLTQAREETWSCSSECVSM